MADFYGTTFTAAKSGTLPQAQPDSRKVGAKQRRILEVFTFAAQAAASRLFLGTLPAGAVFAGVRLTLDTSSGSATLAVGNAGTPAKYKAAAALTATDTPTMYGKASALDDDPLTAPEEVWLTTAAAALPASGILVTELFYTTAA